MLSLFSAQSPASEYRSLTFAASFEIDASFSPSLTAFCQKHSCACASIMASTLSSVKVSMSSGGLLLSSGIISVFKWLRTPAAKQKFEAADLRPSEVALFEESAICEYMAARLNSTFASSNRMLFSVWACEVW